jgi:DNA-binding YbaB/EbfC family protein
MPETPDLNEILQMAQNAQAELQKAQETLDTIEVEGASGGGLVTIRATAKGRVLGVSIDDSLVQQPFEKSMLEDLVAAAFNDARAKADAAAAQELNKMSSTLPMPPGFKLPF